MSGSCSRASVWRVRAGWRVRAFSVTAGALRAAGGRRHRDADLVGERREQVPVQIDPGVAEERAQPALKPAPPSRSAKRSSRGAPRTPR